MKALLHVWSLVESVQPLGLVFSQIVSEEPEIPMLLSELECLLYLHFANDGPFRVQLVLASACANSEKKGQWHQYSRHPLAMILV
jgi:hypothetical protein